MKTMWAKLGLVTLTLASHCAFMYVGKGTLESLGGASEEGESWWTD